MQLVDELITNIDDDGKIQLPLAIRYGLRLMPGDRIAVDHLGDGTIILKKIIEQVHAAEEIGGVEKNRRLAKHGTPSQAEGYPRSSSVLAFSR